jgi:ribosome-binding factor A
VTKRRQEQLASLVEGFAASLFVTRVADPRLQMVNVTRSRVSADLKSAVIFYSILGGCPGGAPPPETQAALDKASGFVRSSMAKRLSLKTAPRVRFVYDRNPDHAQRIQSILSSGGFARDEAPAGGSADEGPPAAAPEGGSAAAPPQGPPLSGGPDA